MKKILIGILCAVAVSAASIMGTLAYLTDKDSVANTFTVGNVDITLDEADVTPDGVEIAGADRVKGNEYHLIPGREYVKDPTVTIVKGSEDSYVRALVTFNCLSDLDAIFAENGGADLLDIFDGYDASVWVYEGETEDTTENTITYEFRYYKTVGTYGADDNLELKPVFTGFTAPTFLDGEDLAKLSTLKITVEAHAIQAETFENDVDAAWAAFDQQHEANP